MYQQIVFVWDYQTAGKKFVVKKQLVKHKLPIKKWINNMERTDAVNDMRLVVPAESLCYCLEQLISAWVTTHLVLQQSH